MLVSFLVSLSECSKTNENNLLGGVHILIVYKMVYFDHYFGLLILCCMKKKKLLFSTEYIVI